MTGLVPLTEAAAFTCGCAVLRTRWFNPERVSIVLVSVAALLAAGLLLALTPEDICIDAGALDATAAWPFAAEATFSGEGRRADSVAGQGPDDVTAACSRRPCTLARPGPR